MAKTSCGCPLSKFDHFRHLEIQNGRVTQDGTSFRLTIPPTTNGYTNAQIDDYGRSQFSWRPGTRLSLKARFSHAADQLKGTAGFGFWNAPFGDPTVKRPALPQAVWFFFGSPPNDLPFFPQQAGNGWVAATVNATGWRALRWAPFTPFVLLLNHLPAFKKRIWPKVLHDLGIGARPLSTDLIQWHRYALEWHQGGCKFWIDDGLVLETNSAPKGPLGFVCWVDNQYMVATGNGRFGWGVVPTFSEQLLEIKEIQLTIDN